MVLILKTEVSTAKKEFNAGIDLTQYKVVFRKCKALTIGEIKSYSIEVDELNLFELNSKFHYKNLTELLIKETY